MNYEDARAYLDTVSRTGSVLGLDSIRRLMSELSDPQDDLKFVHVAGTNGKGSILTFVSSVLMEAGYTVGRYISPSVLGYLERFQVNGRWMEEAELGKYTEEVKEAAKRMEAKGYPYPTVFELETAIAFLYFREMKCDLVALETGMGGSLDSTNIVKTTVVSGFASISMDHVGVLGDTLEEIAAEKAGIIKQSTYVAGGFQIPSVEAILKTKAEEKECDYIAAARDTLIYEGHEGAFQVFSYRKFKKLKLSMQGAYQLENAATAIDILQALNTAGYAISEDAICQGLKKAKWPGRFMILQGEPLVIIDGAHNKDAAHRLREGLDMYFPKQRIFAVAGVFKDKAYESIIEELSGRLSGVWTINLPNATRTLDKNLLADSFTRSGVEAFSSESMEAAIDAGVRAAKEKQGIVLVTGSLSYLGDAIRYIEKMN